MLCPRLVRCMALGAVVFATRADAQQAPTEMSRDSPAPYAHQRRLERPESPRDRSRFLRQQRPDLSVSRDSGCSGTTEYNRRVLSTTGVIHQSLSNANASGLEVQLEARPAGRVAAQFSDVMQRVTRRTIAASTSSFLRSSRQDAIVADGRTYAVRLEWHF
jgi:hypothetical protein